MPVTIKNQESRADSTTTNLVHYIHNGFLIVFNFFLHFAVFLTTRRLLIAQAVRERKLLSVKNPRSKIIATTAHVHSQDKKQSFVLPTQKLQS